MIIIPYYHRHTEFTLQTRLTLATLADVRFAAVARFMAAKARHKQLAASNGDQQQIDRQLATLEDILRTIAEIDQAIFDIYAAHGRIN